jgi:hypothetical protein
MASSIEEIAAMYTECTGCGRAMCTESPGSVEYDGEPYCCKECADMEEEVKP